MFIKPNKKWGHYFFATSKEDRSFIQKWAWTQFWSIPKPSLQSVQKFKKMRNAHPQGNGNWLQPNQDNKNAKRKKNFRKRKKFRKKSLKILWFPVGLWEFQVANHCKWHKKHRNRICPMQMAKAQKRVLATFGLLSVPNHGRAAMISVTKWLHF